MIKKIKLQPNPGRKLISVVLMVFLIWAVPSAAQKKSSAEDKSGISSKLVTGLKFRSIGPALMSGRIIDFAVNPEKHSEYYVAVASGGVWKTINSGTTWTPIFDKQKSYSIGCVTMDPNNHNVVWVGTGENNSQRSVSYGDGVYKSIDGGKSWKNMGLKSSEHIGKIVIDPRNSDVVYVAAQGPLWGPGAERGLYKTTDGGKNWERILDISENTGVNEVHMDPENPDVLYATSYQRRRHVFTLINGGPESAIYKSTDAGKSWRKLKKGLPGGDVGRIGLAVSPVNTNVIYAIIEAADKKGGIFRSVDKGESWKKMNSYVSTSPQYYQELVAHPENVDCFFSLDTWTKITKDGGKTFKSLGNKSRHVDDHALWIDPDDMDHYLIGGDGGIYESYDGGKNWTFKANLPITQFYRVSVDNALPFYNVYGGTQDNNTQGGPSRTTSASGIVNSDWFITKGGDGFESVIDPEDPNIVYSQSQYGWIVRYNKENGEKISIKPMEAKGEEPYRWNWDSPLIISPHSHTRLYFAANKIFRSDDRGNSWKTISGDLSKQTDRNKLKVMDKVWSVDAVAKNASTSVYGNIVSLTESPLREGLIYAGTDDGLINITEDGGLDWRKIEKFTSVPEGTYVSCLLTSQHEANTVYACFDNHKRADFHPYIIKSEDAGKSWKSVTGNLPDNEIVYSIVEDHENPKLLFIGTEFTVYFTINGGENWIKLNAGLPTIAVKDIAIQKRENDLVLGTFGRSFYILDDYSPLRYLDDETLNQSCHIFPVKDALLFIESRPLGGGGKASQGGGYFTAKNPPHGAIFTYFLKDTIRTLKALRKQKEKKLSKSGSDIPFPSYDDLRKEDTEEKPYLLFTIYDEQDNVVRRLKKPTKAGINRVSWDLRTHGTSFSPYGNKEGELYNGPTGYLVSPGKYKVRISKNVNGELTELAGPVDFLVKPLYKDQLDKTENDELIKARKEFAELNRVAKGIIKAAHELEQRMDNIQKALHITPNANPEMFDEAKRIDKELKTIFLQLEPDEVYDSRNAAVPQTINSRMNYLYRTFSNSFPPTQTMKEQYDIVKEEIDIILQDLNKLIDVDVNNLEIQMEKAGAPYTPGRIPEFK